VGRSVPDFELLDGTAVGSLLRDGRGLLLDFESDAQLRTLTNGRQARINHISSDVKNGLGLRAVLVRPDGIVAWARESAGR
jgi:hypothetical protein